MDYTEVVLFNKYNFHNAGMIPISKALTELGIAHTLTGKRHEIYDCFNNTGLKYKVFVIGDEWGNLFRGCSENLLTISHSMVNKNTTLNEKNEDMDYICVPSQYYKTEYLKRNIKPRKDFLITGFSYADKIFNQAWDRECWWHESAIKKNIAQKNI